VYRAMGADFITHSFKVAAQTDPNAKLYYNDFNIERCCNAKINATISLVKNAIAAGARIDGIGMQGHSRVGKSPSKQELKDTMSRFSELVSELAYTEIDIRHTQMPASASDREQQAKDYLDVVNACLETPKCVGITIWDFTDQVSRRGPKKLDVFY
jgi:endo-1,4-beta-xylanase